MDGIDFFLSAAITPTRIGRWCQDELGLNAGQVVVVGDFAGYCSQHDVDPAKAYVAWLPGPGAFGARVEVYGPAGTARGMGPWVAGLKRLARQIGVSILAGDEGPNPYRFVLVGPSGYCASVGVDADRLDHHGELCVSGYDNPLFGQFMLKTPWAAGPLKKQLGGLFQPCFGAFALRYRPVGPTTDPDFAQYQKQDARLAEFRHYYSIWPTGRQPWHTIPAKSAAFTRQMQAFCAQHAIAACLFPADYQTVRNIPGGTDHASYCILASEGRTEKITYKTPRKSW